MAEGFAPLGHFFSGDLTYFLAIRLDALSVPDVSRRRLRKLIGARAPGPALARRRRLEGAAQHIAAPLSFEIVRLRAVRHLELYVTAAHEAFDRHSGHSPADAPPARRAEIHSAAAASATPSRRRDALRFPRPCPSPGWAYRVLRPCWMRNRARCRHSNRRRCMGPPRRRRYGICAARNIAR